MFYIKVHAQSRNRSFCVGAQICLYVPVKPREAKLKNSITAVPGQTLRSTIFGVCGLKIFRKNLERTKNS